MDFGQRGVMLTVGRFWVLIWKPYIHSCANNITTNEVQEGGI